MIFSEFSNKQQKVLSWWMPDSPVNHYEGIIGDGSIRSGKTLSFGISFFAWAMSGWIKQANFAMCGKTINSFRRNVWSWLKPLLIERGYNITEERDSNKITVTLGPIINYFYVFGGKDERSQDLIQGVTLAGVLFDEVALMPESFVNQATGRCSITGSRFWFNCNPENPKHWFKERWIDKAKTKKLIYLHFTMDDNLSLSTDIKERYMNLYTGVFYKRFILGLWVMAEGAIYDNWDESENTYSHELSPYLKESSSLWVGLDYGTTNPLAALLGYDDGETLWIDKEYYFNSREEGYQKTDEQYCNDLEEWLGDEEEDQFIVDPSAASFIVLLRSRGHRVKEADNEVLDGIRLTSTLIGKRKIKIHTRCVNLIKEIGGYVWDDASVNGKEKPLKFNDHACLYGGTKIVTTGGIKSIKDLVGTTGKCYGRTGLVNYDNVTCTGVKNLYQFTTKSGRVIIATLDHPVATSEGFKPIGHTKDLIYKENGRWLIDEIITKKFFSNEKVYNMTTSDHTFLLENGILVHNCDALRYIVKTKINPRRIIE